MHPIFGLIGPSGSGKTTLILEMVRRWPEKIGCIKTLTSRNRRGPEDDPFYDFLTREEIEKRQAEGRLLQLANFAGNVYATDRKDVYQLLEKQFGIMAVVEPAIKDFRAGGCEMILIKLTPKNFHTRDAVRQKADEERAKTPLVYDHEVINSFEPGGKRHAIEELATILRRYIEK